MKTQMEAARNGTASRELKAVSRREGIAVEELLGNVAMGRAVIPFNKRHPSLKAMGIGKGLKVKINANIGTSSLKSSLGGEVKKIECCERFGADTAMDLSTAGNVDRIRKAIIRNASIPIGTVPVYQTVLDAGGIERASEENFLETIERHAEQGVSFMTVHAGIRRKHFPLLGKRLTGVVSRGGCLLLNWMKRSGMENPFYTQFDEMLAVAKRHDVTLSLGDGLRPGSLHDASDAAQFAELRELGKLTERAWGEGVQVIIEGPGHVPINEIKRNVEVEKRLCHGAPFYVLGPLVTDVAAGYDHISAAIGAAFAGFHGADFLCYVTAKEHLSLPDLGDVREGIVAFKIVAHAVDVARGLKGAKELDLEMSRARAGFDWEKQFRLALDPQKAKSVRENGSARKGDYCSMCGPEFCSMRLFKRFSRG